MTQTQDNANDAIFNQETIQFNPASLFAEVEARTGQTVDDGDVEALSLSDVSVGTEYELPAVSGPSVSLTAPRRPEGPAETQEDIDLSNAKTTVQPAAAILAQLAPMLGKAAAAHVPATVVEESAATERSIEDLPSVSEDVREPLSAEESKWRNWMHAAIVILAIEAITGLAIHQYLSAKKADASPQAPATTAQISTSQNG